MALKRLGSTKLTDQVLQTSVTLTTEVSGTLGVANGGTGQSVFTNGQLLIGNTTGNTLTKATLTQGSGITITNGAGSITIASTASDPWTYAKVTGSDYTNNTTTLGTITNLSFTPAASTVYEIEAMLMVSTSSNTSNARTAIVWPTAGITSGVGFIQQPGAAATTLIYTSGNTGATIQVAAGDLPAPGTNHPVFIKALLNMTTGATGDFRLQMASESAGQTITVRQQSFLKYRTI